jgi:LL-diaminopimelate aminotransferase
MIKNIIIDKADRLYHFPLELEDYFPRRVTSTGTKKYPVIDLGHFSWDIPFEERQIETKSMAAVPEAELTALTVRLSRWLEDQFGVKADPAQEIYIGQGIRRIFFDICMAFVEDGDIVLCPEPGIPFYRRMAIAAGGFPVSYRISRNSDFRISFKVISDKLSRAAKLLILNNPHNPLGYMWDEIDLTELLRIASQENLCLVNDAAYCAFARDRYRPLLSIRGGRKVGVDIFSVPYTLGLPRLPLAFAVGQREIINGLKTVGKSIGFYISSTWAEMFSRALDEYPSAQLKEFRNAVSEARFRAHELADKLEWVVVDKGSSPFMWVRIPGRALSSDYATNLLRRKKIITLPGVAFGESGEGYLRLSLTAGAGKYQEAIERMKRPLILRRRKKE